MNDHSPVSFEAGREQIRYANVLEKGMLIGLAALLVTFILYASGLVEPFIPVERISEYWSLDVRTYLQETGGSAGWAWVGMLGYGDFLNFVGIAMLAGTTIVCYLAIVPILWKSNDKVYVVLALVEVIVLVAAASGVLGSGGH